MVHSYCSCVVLYFDSSCYKAYVAMADFRTGPARKVNTAAGRGFKYVQCTCSGVSTALRTELGALNYDMAGLYDP